MPVRWSLDGSEWTVTATREVRYRVRICEDLLACPSATAEDVLGDARKPPHQRVIVADRGFLDVWGAKFEDYLRALDIDPVLIEIDGGEQNKTLRTFETVVQRMQRARIARRSEPIIAVGGGVVLDIVGFAASTFRRGTPWVRIPTTLLAQLDAGIGAKTGIDYDGTRNDLGSYHPGATLIDPVFLGSLPEKEIVNGLGEAVKVAVMKEPELFAIIEAHGARLVETRFQGSEVHGAGLEVLHRAIGAMLPEQADNLWEDNLARWMDFGHTWSPALEMADLPNLLHGFAVALDVALSAMIACVRGWLPVHVHERIVTVLLRLGLPIWHPLMGNSGLMARALDGAVKKRDGRQLIPLPTGIGAARFVDDVGGPEVTHAVTLLRDRAAQWNGR